jgi:aspartyl-tRNA(Asn)/glutamyl-tRNA(Gln) amidotransferase subunit C
MVAKNKIAGRIDVEYVAKLARLYLKDDEKKLFQRQLEDILEFVNEISEIDVKDVPPLASVSGTQNVFRGDEPAAGLERETVLKNAPLNDGQQFLVPKIV